MTVPNVGGKPFQSTLPPTLEKAFLATILFQGPSEKCTFPWSHWLGQVFQGGWGVGCRKHYRLLLANAKSFCFPPPPRLHVEVPAWLETDQAVLFRRSNLFLSKMECRVAVVSNASSWQPGLLFQAFLNPLLLINTWLSCLALSPSKNWVQRGSSASECKTKKKFWKFKVLSLMCLF